MVTARAMWIVGTMWSASACSLVFPSDEYAGGSGQGAELQGDALLARYFIDEAASGTEPLALHDVTSSGPDLFISYEGDAQFGERAGNRGLFWADTGLDGVASGPIGGTTLANALSAAQQATFELVVAVDDGPGTFLAISSGMTLEVTTTAVEADWLGGGYGWTGFSRDGARRVVHLRIDTASSSPVELLMNGVALPVDMGSVIAPNEALELAASDSTLWLGNEEYDLASIAGGILYLAIYGSALTDGQIDGNVARLLSSDDGS